MNSVFVEHSISVIPDLFSFYTKGSQSQREKKLFSHKIIDFLSINIWDIKLVMVPKHSMFLNDNVLWFMMILQLWMCVCVCVCVLSRVGLFVTRWTVAARLLYPWVTWQEYWCGLPLPSPGDRPNPGTAPTSPALESDSLEMVSPGKPDILVGYHQ